MTQTTFVKALTRWDQLRDTSRARPWLLQIAYREALTVLRRRRERPLDPSTLPETIDSDPGPEAAALATDVARLVHLALGRMAPDERAAVTLRDVEGSPWPRWPTCSTSASRQPRCGSIGVGALSGSCSGR